jgi:hypothetical protein
MARNTCRKISQRKCLRRSTLKFLPKDMPGKCKTEKGEAAAVNAHGNFEAS